jgi:oligopeptide/dipeptide ABC transporter ATP-binding protein
MYAGTLVEQAPVAQLFAEPLHPYTQGLLASAPTLDGGRRRLTTIEGMVPNLAHLPAGCRFRDRCPQAIARCAQQEPPLIAAGPGRRVACFVAAQRLGIEV